MIISRLVNLIWNDKAKIVKPHFSYKKLHIILLEGELLYMKKQDVTTLLHPQEFRETGLRMI